MTTIYFQINNETDLPFTFVTEETQQGRGNGSLNWDTYPSDIPPNESLTFSSEVTGDITQSLVSVTSLL